MARARAALDAPVAATAGPVSRGAAAPVGRSRGGRLWSSARSRCRGVRDPCPVGARVGDSPAAVVSAPDVVASAPAVRRRLSVAVPDLPPAGAPTLAAPGPSPADAAREELHLMREARAAVARGDFAAALSPIAEHTRRFKNGRLVEEREALRVKALGGLGRAEEARHAAAAFRARFPRSVLLPAVGQMPAPGP